MKRLLSLFLSLLLVVGCGAGAVAAPGDGLTVSFETAVYSISGEKFIRTLPEPASLDSCGEDEYISLCVVFQNTSGSDLPLRDLCISIDGGEKLYWTDFNLQAGKTARFHVYYVHADHLTAGLHRATVYASGQPLYSGRFSIGRAWSEVFQLPTEQQVAARPADGRSPYVATWLSTGKDARFDAYCVDFKSDHIPYGTYSCLFNGYLDFSSLKEEYASVESDGHISLYGGLQQGAEGKPSNSILSFWDIYCTDQQGNQVVIRPKQTYSVNGSEGTSFTGEGDGAHTLLPYEWKVGRWYRMLLQCGTSETTGNTTVDQWFQDLTTGKWTRMCTYDTGIKNSGFRGNVAVFSENFLKQYAGGVRSLEFTNMRIHTSQGWKDVVSTTGGFTIQTSGIHANAYGSWQAGADQTCFYMISTGVSGWGRTEKTDKYTIRNRESGSPLQETASPSNPANNTNSQQAPSFADVSGSAYYAQPVAWAVQQGITTGTSKTQFSPGSTCTQGQIITFLWRSKGSPKPAKAVTGSEYYAAAVQWAREQGLIDGTFSAKAPCTRAMVVTYLWKLAGSPQAGSAGFADVAGTPYEQAVVWAVDQKITTGTGINTFSPDQTCTRGQIVTFLYRAFAK